MRCQQRSLVIHAGTHKTASTYIQNRLIKNKQNLLDRNIYLFSPKKTGQHFKFAGWIKEQDFEKILRKLQRIPQSVGNVIISAEQFTQVLIQGRLLEAFLEVASRAGFQVKIVFFLREQPDYINSLYIQEVRRFYHHRSVNAYVKHCISKKRHWFDYEFMFSGLLDHPKVSVEFLPYGFSFGDPFERLMQSQSWLHDISWAEADAKKSNDQPGARGVWLALRVSEKLEQMRIAAGGIENRSKYIRKYSDVLGWSSDRFYGLSRAMIELIRNHYHESNNRFAQRVWQRDWNDVFGDIRKVKKNIFKIDSVQSAEQPMYWWLVDQVVTDIRISNPSLFAGTNQ